MKQGRSKRKGNSYEIKISRILTKWYCDSFIKKRNDKEDWFWRTAGSGAKSTITRSSQTSFCGDITFLPDPDRLRVWIDTKDRKEATFNSILTDNFIIEKWYREEKVKMDKLGINKPIIIIFTLYRKKEDYVYFNAVDITMSDYIKETNIQRNHIYMIMKLEDFLKNVKRREILL